MDAIEQRMASTGAQLAIVEKALTGWWPNNDEERQSMDQFKRYCVALFSTNVD